MPSKPPIVRGRLVRARARRCARTAGGRGRGPGRPPRPRRGRSRAAAARSRPTWATSRRVGEPVADEVVARRADHLGLGRQPPQRRGVHDAGPVTLERRTGASRSARRRTRSTSAWSYAAGEVSTAATLLTPRLARFGSPTRQVWCPHSPGLVAEPHPWRLGAQSLATGHSIVGESRRNSWRLGTRKLASRRGQPPETPISAEASMISSSRSSSQPSGRATRRGLPCRPRGLPSSTDRERLARVEPRQQHVEVGERVDQPERLTQLAAGREALEVPRDVLAELLAAALLAHVLDRAARHGGASSSPPRPEAGQRRRGPPRRRRRPGRGTATAGRGSRGPTTTPAHPVSSTIAQRVGRLPDVAVAEHRDVDVLDERGDRRTSRASPE